MLGSELFSLPSDIFCFTNPYFVLLIHDRCFVLLSPVHFRVHRFSLELTLCLCHPLKRHSLINTRITVYKSSKYGYFHVEHFL